MLQMYYNKVAFKNEFAIFATQLRLNRYEDNFLQTRYDWRFSEHILPYTLFGNAFYIYREDMHRHVL